jgi:hypothetical protein
VKIAFRESFPKDLKNLKDKDLMALIDQTISFGELARCS